MMQQILLGYGGGASFPDPSTIGTAVEGGYFGGLYSSTGNGVATHALIVAPAATGASGTGYTNTTMLKYQSSSSSTGATSLFNGYANTYSYLVGSNSPAADFCTNLTIGGFTDWYLPSRLELEILYYHLKPTSDANNTASGINAYAVPARTSNYTTGSPSQTSISLFQSGGSEAFQADTHWTSTEDSTVRANHWYFNNGALGNSLKGGTRRVRAIRKVAV